MAEKEEHQERQGGTSVPSAQNEEVGQRRSATGYVPSEYSEEAQAREQERRDAREELKEEVDEEAFLPPVLHTGLLTVRVTNETSQEISKGQYVVPPDSSKTFTVPASDVLQLRARMGLDVEVLHKGATDDSTEIDKPFHFIKDQDQNVTNRSPGESLEDWLAPTSAETPATPALKHGRLAEVRLEKGAAERAEELDIDLMAVSGTGEEGMVLIRDVENAYEGVAPHPQAGVKGGATAPPREQGVLSEGVLEAPGEDVSGPSADTVDARERQRLETAKDEALEESDRDAIEHQRERDSTTPPPPHSSGPDPENVVGEPSDSEVVIVSEEGDEGEVTHQTDEVSEEARRRNVDLRDVRASKEDASEVTADDVRAYHEEHGSSGAVDEAGQEPVVPDLEPQVDEREKPDQPRSGDEVE